MSDACPHLRTRTDPRPWPTGETLEVCDDCGMSRVHWEQGASGWEMIDDLEAARAELDFFLSTPAEHHPHDDYIRDRFDSYEGDDLDDEEDELDNPTYTEWGYGV